VNRGIENRINNRLLWLRPESQIDQ